MIKTVKFRFIFLKIQLSYAYGLFKVTILLVPLRIIYLVFNFRFISYNRI